MHLNCLAAIILRQFYLIRGSFSRVLPLFVWVAVDMVLWGFIAKYLNSVTLSGINFVPVFLGAVLLWDFLVRVMQGVTMAFFEDVWSRNFLNVFATPLTISEYISGLVLTSIATSSVGLIVMILLATSLFGLPFFSSLLIVPFLALLFLFGIALGIFGIAVVLRFGPAAEWFIWPVPALIVPFVGVFYPPSVLPNWMRFISLMLPPSYVFEGLRTIVSAGTVSASALLWGGCLALLYVLSACGFFVLMYRRAVRTGLIARYSAETLS